MIDEADVEHASAKVPKVRRAGLDAEVVGEKLRMRTDELMIGETADQSSMTITTNRNPERPQQAF